jgi:hypothetical protein
VKAVIPHPHHDPCSLRTRLTKALKLTSSHAAAKLLGTTRIVFHVTRVLDGLAA